METLRYGIVGGGFLAAFQCRALEEVRGVEVAGFVSKDPVDHLLAYAKEQGLGDAREFASITEMVPEVDVVAIFCPNFARVEVVEEIADAVTAGAELKGLICEKLTQYIHEREEPCPHPLHKKQTSLARLSYQILGLLGI